MKVFYMEIGSSSEKGNIYIYNISVMKFPNEFI